LARSRGHRGVRGQRRGDGVQQDGGGASARGVSYTSRRSIPPAVWSRAPSRIRQLDAIWQRSAPILLSTHGDQQQTIAAKKGSTMSVNPSIHRIAIVGTGVIGASWATYYLSRGFD